MSAIKPCPPPGRGVHLWAYHAYNKMRSQGHTHEEAEAYCHQHATRLLSPGDIPSGPAGTNTRRRSKSFGHYRPEALQALASKMPYFGRFSLFCKSPLDPSTQTAATFLRELFLPGEQVLLTTTYNTKGRCFWELPEKEEAFDRRHLDGAFRYPFRNKGAWFLANPVNAQWVSVPRLVRPENPKGLTRRSEENLTAFRYLVLESDLAPAELWLPALAQLPVRIASITTSGGKSVHALVRVDARDAAEWRALRDTFAPGVVALGADPAAMTSVRLTRLPGCFRYETQRWQELLFLNPNPSGTPICDLPNQRTPGGPL
jgi:hypothetical protein